MAFHIPHTGDCSGTGSAGCTAGVAPGDSGYDLRGQSSTKAKVKMMLLPFRHDNAAVPRGRVSESACQVVPVDTNLAGEMGMAGYLQSLMQGS